MSGDDDTLSEGAERRPFALPVERARIDRAGLAGALALIEQVVGLPRVARVVLARAVGDGADGEVTVDAYDQVMLRVWGDAARAATAPEYLATMFDLWAGLTGAISRWPGPAVQIALRALAPRERTMVGGRAVGEANAADEASAVDGGDGGAANGDVLERVRALAGWGYRVPMPVAMALTAAALSGSEVELRATESVGRGWIVAMVEAHVTGGAPLEGVGEALSRWVEGAQPGPLIVDRWRDEAGGWHFMDVWASDRPSGNWLPPEGAAV